MPKYHARAKALRAIKTGLDIKHAEAIAVLDDPRCEELCYYMANWGLTTYAAAVAMVEDPFRQVLCEKCGWTKGMACPDCKDGCGCNTECSNWRHIQYTYDEDEHGCIECGGDDGQTYGCSCFDPTRCPECGASSQGYGCDCRA